MKRTLEGLVSVFTLSVMGCAVNNSAVATYTPSTVTGVPDGKYDSVDDSVNRSEVQKIRDVSYMVISESKYKTTKDEEITLHSLGTAVIYADIGKKTYLATADHVVQNEETIFSFSKGELKKVSEKFYLLEDYQVKILHESLRKLNESKEQEDLYVKDASGNMREPLNYIIKTSDEMASILKSIKPRIVKTVAHNEVKDLAVISVPRLTHLPVPYSIGSGKELQVYNILFVVGYPRGLIENVTSGHVTSENDSSAARPDPETNFIFDAPISPGNSGGGIFAVRDGRLELVGITSAMYGGNDLGIGVKIDGISEVFKGDRIICSKDWKCNRSSPYELRL